MAATHLLSPNTFPTSNPTNHLHVPSTLPVSIVGRHGTPQAVLLSVSTTEVVCVCVFEQAFTLGDDPTPCVPRILLPVHVRLQVIVGIGALEVVELGLVLRHPPRFRDEERVVRPVAKLGFGAVPHLICGRRPIHGALQNNVSASQP